mmetsp:Transcript_42071/g.117132  ORF Transcript_42071/g.117132 Transcript_42071/m.117132 type:complete len:208 (-) Transcript_42071:41-664(-)
MTCRNTCPFSGTPSASARRGHAGRRWRRRYSPAAGCSAKPPRAWAPRWRSSLGRTHWSAHGPWVPESALVRCCRAWTWQTTAPSRARSSWPPESPACGTAAPRLRGVGTSGSTGLRAYWHFVASRRVRLCASATAGTRTSDFSWTMAFLLAPQTRKETWKNKFSTVRARSIATAGCARTEIGLSIWWQMLVDAEEKQLDLCGLRGGS